MTAMGAAEYYAGLNPEWLLCRAYGHAWEPYTATHTLAGYEVTVRCSRCDTLKRDMLTDAGKAVGHSSFSYTPGYQNAGAGRTLVGTRGIAKVTSVAQQIARKQPAATERGASNLS